MVTATQIDVHTQGHANDAVGVHHQCFPTSCVPDARSTSGLSPTWTDMIEGTDVACLDGWTQNRDQGFRLSTQFSGTPDNLCA